MNNGQVIVYGDSGCHTQLKVTTMKVSTPRVFFDQPVPESKWRMSWLSAYLVDVNSGKPGRLLTAKLCKEEFGNTGLRFSPYYKAIVGEDT